MLALLLLVLAADPIPTPAVVEQSQSAARIAEKLAELRALFEQLECERLIGLAPYVEDHRLATKAERHEAMFRRGYCLVVIGNTGEADQLFGDIMREDVEAKPGFPIEPRVLAFVESARNEVMKQRDAAIVAARAARVARVALAVESTRAVKGGNRAFFDVKLTDPDAIVRSMRVDFRKRGELEYYALPVLRRADGTWHGEVPGMYTRSSSGTTLEWFITVSDDQGEMLKTEGTREVPRSLEVLPGSAVAEDLKASERVPQPTRIVAGVAVTPFFAVVGVATGLLVAVAVDAAGTQLFGGSVGNAAGGVTLLLLPMTLGTGTVFLLEYTILDAPASFIATAIVGGFLVLGEVFLLADWIDKKRNLAHVIALSSVGDDENGGAAVNNETAPVLALAASSVLLAALAGAVATPILVGLDAHAE